MAHDPEHGKQLAYANNSLGQEVILTEWPDKSASVTVVLMSGGGDSVMFLPSEHERAWLSYRELANAVTSYDVRHGH